VESLPHPQKALQRSRFVYQWNFGGGAVSLLPAGVCVLHIYRHPGTYSRLLTMTTLHGRSRGLRLSRRTTDVRLRCEMRVCQPEAGVGSMLQFLQNATNKPSQISAAAAQAIRTFVPRTLFPFSAERLESHGRDPGAWSKIL
jgi:hypothetical protein